MLEPVFFSEGFESLSFYFLFFYSFSGQMELPSAVTNSGRSRRGSGRFGADYSTFIGIFKKNERSSAPPKYI